MLIFYKFLLFDSYYSSERILKWQKDEERHLVTSIFTSQNIFNNLSIYCTSSEKNQKKNNRGLQMHLDTEQEWTDNVSLAFYVLWMGGFCTPFATSKTRHWCSTKNSLKHQTSTLRQWKTAWWAWLIFQQNVFHRMNVEKETDSEVSKNGLLLFPHNAAKMSVCVPWIKVSANA